MIGDKKLSSPELLFRAAQDMGLMPSWITPNGMFAVSINGKEVYINSARSSLSSHLSSSLTKNKYLTRLILERHGLLNIPFLRTRSLVEAKSFLAAHKKIIAKPFNGAGSKDIHIITEASQLNDLTIYKNIFEKYIVGAEMRYLVLNGSVIAVHRSEYGTSVEADRPLQRISYAVTDWDESLIANAQQIADILDLNFTAVDYMIDEVGNAYILEVNSTPGLKWFHAPSSGPAVDVAGLFLKAMLGGATPAQINAATFQLNLAR